jgi:murein DD-endopeptidase MepM/ murein hydrolase activator NlpD
MRVAVAVAGATAALAGCSRVAELRERVAPASPHERYAEGLRAAGLGSTALGAEWLRAADAALVAARPVTLPAREAVYLAPDEPAALGYRARLRRGERLVVEVEASGGAPALVFVDLFRREAGAVAADGSVAADGGAALAPRFERLASADSAGARVETVAREDGEVVVRLQPELLRGGRVTVTLRTDASLAFPVEGRTSRAVQSFWGAARDGGRRRHEGVDIFAPRGTPAVAATDGVVTGVRATAIGGNVVWLRDDHGPQTLYYAHLDTQFVARGQRVRLGDTLGLVGNTGNAASTAPHLHFGVYTRSGPVDPYPFVRTPRPAPPPVAADLAALGEWRRVREGAAALRDAPADGASLGRLERHTLVRVEGAAGSSYRVRLPTGAPGGGYLAAAALEPVARPVGRPAARAAAAVLDRPAPGAATMDSVAAGERLEQLGRSGGYAAVRTGAGRIGWVPADAL